MSYYQLTFESSVTRQPAPLSIIRVDPAESEAPRKAVEALRAGALIIFPTETGYVVGCSALDAGALRRLRDVTGADESQLLRFAGTPDQAKQVSESVQMLRHPVPLELMRSVGLPLAASVKPPGAMRWPTAQHAVFVLGDAVDLVLDAGRISPDAQAAVATTAGSSVGR